MENEFRIKTLRYRFDELLIRVANNLTSEDRTKFRYIFRESLPQQILERDEPLVWFEDLERKGKLAADNLGLLENVLRQSELIALLNVVKRFKIKQQLFVAFREASEHRSRGRLHFEVLPADQQFCNHQPSKYFVRKCKNVIGRFSTSSGWNRKNVVVLFNRTVELYTKSCNVEGYGAEMMYYKALYLVDQMFLKFGSWLLESADVVPFPIKKTTKKSCFKRSKKNRISPNEPLANNQHPAIQTTCQPATAKMELHEAINHHLAQISNSVKILTLFSGLGLAFTTCSFVIILAMNFS